MKPPPIIGPTTRATVMGLGSFGGGVGLTRYLAEQGARVTVTDLQSAEALGGSIEALRDVPIRFVLGEHRDVDFIETDVVFVNPAVPLASPYLALSRAHNVPWDSEINLFVRQCRGRIAGITGSVGKSTTTSLLGSILQCHDARTLVGGNIGGSLLPHLASIAPDTPVVLELSSFQLEHLAWQAYSPPLAVVLNLTPNHLDRHGTMAAYEQAKAGILAHQAPDDTAILNADEAAVCRIAEGCGRGQRLFYSTHTVLANGVYRDHDRIVLARNGASKVLFHQSDLLLHGGHNLGNAAAAAAAATCLGVAPDAIARGLRAFRGLPHRLEWIAAKAGVQYYNDSKATTPLSTIRALEAFAQPLILLAGGYDKGVPFDALARAVHKHAKAAVVYGATAPKLTQALAQVAAANPGPAQAQVLQGLDLEQALHLAIGLAAPGDVVLLSPACASYDQFPHYEARGAYFRALVEALPSTVTRSRVEHLTG